MKYEYNDVPAPNWRERLNEAMAGRNVSEVARALKISPHAIYQWLDGATKAPDRRHWLPLARSLNVNLFWLFLGCDDKGDAPMNSQEVEILHKYRKLSPDKQAQVKSLIEAWLVDEALSSPTERAAG